MAAKVSKIGNAQPESQDLIFWCPGCKCAHGIRTKESSPQYGWDWNGDYERPTINPSVLTWGTNTVINEQDGSVSGVDFRCHSFIRDGKIEFLSDCTHELAGMTVDMEEL